MYYLTHFLQNAELANCEFSSERETFLVVDNAAQQVVMNGGNGNDGRKKVQCDESLLYDSSNEEYNYDERNKSNVKMILLL